MRLVILYKVIRGAEYQQYDGRIVKRKAIKSADRTGSDMAQMSVESNFELIP